MCSWIVTLPKHQPGADQGGTHAEEWPDAARGQFFERVYDFLCARYGEKNVISAYVHMDEVTPHLHFSFVPVTADLKRGGEKVCAKEVLTKRDLQAFHGDLEQHLDRFQDLHFEVVNEATKDGNRSVAELKKATYHAEVVQARQEASESRSTADTLRGDINTLEGRKTGLEREIGALQTKKDTLTAAEVDALKGTKTITGALKGITYADYEALRRTAQRVGNVDAERDAALKRAASADQRAAVAEERARQAQTEKPSVKLTMENGKLRARLDRIEGWLTRLLDFLPEQFRTLVQNILRDRDPFQQRQDRQQPQR
jgi:hypothetical protein